MRYIRFGNNFKEKEEREEKERTKWEEKERRKEQM